MIKAPIRQNTSHPPPPSRVSFLVLETKLDGGYPPAVFQKQEKHVHLKPQRRALKQATVHRRGAIGQREFTQHQRGLMLTAAWRKIPTLLWAPQDECCDRLRMSALRVGRGHVAHVSCVFTPTVEGGGLHPPLWGPGVKAGKRPPRSNCEQATLLQSCFHTCPQGPRVTHRTLWVSWSAAGHRPSGEPHETIHWSITRLQGVLHGHLCAGVT